MNVFKKIVSKIGKSEEICQQQAVKATIITETLSCPDCAKKISTIVQGRPGVVQADVVFVASKVKVEYQPDRINLDEIVKVIQSTGYKVLEIREGK